MTMPPNNSSFEMIPQAWKDYELLDSGDGMKRERWGDLILIRPDVAAYWRRRDLQAWETWDGWFQTDEEQRHGKWVWKKQPPSSWKVQYHDLSFIIRPTTSKQVGLFPEQALNWDWCAQKISTAQRPIKVLNLFGYTGAASIVAAQAGASVCHVDASKAMVSWCADNAKTSQLAREGDKPSIRFIVDDCMKFVNRELKRGHHYDAIILDPPSFGRGGAGEIWRLEDQLLSLLETCRALLSEKPLFLMMSSYSASILNEKLQEYLKEVFNSYGTDTISELFLGLQGSQDGNILPCGVTARWEADIVK